MMRHIGSPLSRFKATLFIEPMNSRVFATALKEDVIAVTRPRGGQCSLDDCTTMTLALKVRVRDNILEKRVLLTVAQEIW